MRLFSRSNALVVSPPSFASGIPTYDLSAPLLCSKKEVTAVVSVQYLRASGK